MVMVLVNLFKGIGKLVYYTGYGTYKLICGLFGLASEAVDRVDNGYERLDNKLLKLEPYNLNKNKKKEDKSLENKIDQYDTKIVTTDEDMIKYTNQGYECKPIGEKRWLMKKRITNSVATNK